MNEKSSYLQAVAEFMNMGLDEDAACREAFALLYPETYDASDYDA